jgi:hypothetical protein
MALIGLQALHQEKQRSERMVDPSPSLHPSQSRERLISWTEGRRRPRFCRWVLVWEHGIVIGFSGKEASCYDIIVTSVKKVFVCVC